MKATLFKSLILFPLVVLAASAADPNDPLNFKNIIDLNAPEVRGHTFLSTMENFVKPELDKSENGGFKVADGAMVENLLRHASPKVQRKVINALRPANRATVVKLADVLSTRQRLVEDGKPGSISNEKNLATQILAAFRSGSGIAAADRNSHFDMKTFIGLASGPNGSGVAVKLDERNYTYHTLYATGKEPPVVTSTGKTLGPEQSGRSFAVNLPSGVLNDASDSEYLRALERVVKESKNDPEALSNFYRAILLIILDSDGSELKKLSDEGQAVAGDFVTVYVAEQARNLMFDLTRFEFDKALAEITFLSAFSAGGSKTVVSFEGKITDQPNTIDFETRLVLPTTHRATLNDWFRFSNDPSSNRSGINVTKFDRAVMCDVVTRWERAKNPGLVKALEDQMIGFREITGRNPGLHRVNRFSPASVDCIAEDFSDYTISRNRLRSERLSVQTNAKALTEAYVKLLSQIQKDADQIFADVQSGAIKVDPLLAKAADIVPFVPRAPRPDPDSDN